MEHMELFKRACIKSGFIEIGDKIMIGKDVVIVRDIVKVDFVEKAIYFYGMKMKHLA